jgi:Amt family ammonium transporter
MAGLDIPEMGQLGYPEFVFREEPAHMTAHAMAVA